MIRRLLDLIHAALSRRVDHLSTIVVDGTRYSLKPYSEADDEIGGRRDYYDGLGD